MTFDDYIGHERIVTALRRMAAEGRLPQTMLFAGPRGVGKATLARLLTAAINCTTRTADACGTCPNCARVLRADLSQDEYQEMFREREKMPAAQRGDNPLVVSTHPDFLVFPPDGPMRIITIEQARRLRHAARFAPSEGRRRVFLIDHADRANDEAANSLLKTLEEPAERLTIILTAENPYELLPTIRSRAISFYFGRLSAAEMNRFFTSRNSASAIDPARLAAWAQGSPGEALSIDTEEFLERRVRMLALLKTALGQAPFGELISQTESLARQTSQRLDSFTAMLASLLEDLLHLHLGQEDACVHTDIRAELSPLARRIHFGWLAEATARLAELDELQRRNIQKQVALEALAIGLRRHAAS